MRDLMECQAEVFRRSEMRIKERKRRRTHILMACVPVVLCISLYSAFVLPNMMNTESNDFAEPEMYLGGLPEDTCESLICSISQITIAGSGFSQSYTDLDQILRISNRLKALETRGWGDGNSEVADDEDGSGNTSGVTADSATAGYRITLVMHEGENSRYLLAGNTLKNLLTDRTHTLTQIQVYELYDLLGIPY
ncbi:MAG: hypothetical protein IJW41_04375 [Oscillospiraceae bacterium]|nr:hypothetical protein [Oscillospiraceae bacterium]